RTHFHDGHLGGFVYSDLDSDNSPRRYQRPGFLGSSRFFFLSFRASNASTIPDLSSLPNSAMELSQTLVPLLRSPLCRNDVSKMYRTRTNSPVVARIQ